MLHRSVITILFVTFFLLTSSCKCEEKEVLFELSLKESKCALDNIQVELRVTAFRQMSVLNPYANRLLPIPYKVFLLNENKDRVTEFQIEPRAGSRRSANEDDWVDVAENGFIGTTILLSVRELQDTRKIDVLPGSYYLQAACPRWFFSDPPTLQEIRAEKDGQKWIYTRSREPYMVSDPISITLTENK